MPQTQRSHNIRPINLSNSDLSAEKKFKLRVKRIHRRRVTALSLVMFVIVTAFSFQLYQSRQTKAQTQVQWVQQQHKLQRARSQYRDLSNQVRQLHNAEYLDNLIRYRFNYSHDGEIIYNIPNEANKNLNF
ncbi:MAG: septum formation initiator family protein [Bombilactobacillus mellis]|nr:septum formation initiator family protein [Bombilactobacillus mellis]